ncbi:hypothetical protein PBRA_000117 [Plasmodiophora brassicae]|uniref:DDE Tnp4 domain-containing protein n=1 Tax=Plasmodiophora brassicae TaxID=37360 RepID=A0A0G4IGY2_PLABS|nr:hypothetical protein PBRA_000117 [Plasmodiophora brassicae]
MSADVIALPEPGRVPSQIRNNRKWFPYFKDCLGALDGTHIPCQPPKHRARPFRNRKHFASQNVLAVCSFNLRFMYVLAGWEGSASDGRVLGSAMSKSFVIPNGKYYLGDAGYALSSYCLTRYRGELFNLRHSQARNAIERVIGVLKKRFSLLATVPQYPFGTQVHLVYALCALHNVISDLEDHEYFEAQYLEDLAIRDALRKTRPPRPQQHFPAPDDHAMKSKRDAIAQAMWEDYINIPRQCNRGRNRRQ